MPYAIDWTFITRLGHGRRAPEVPDTASGITLASGVDLGRRTPAEIKALRLQPALEARLMPYAGKAGAQARQALKVQPLALAPAESRAIDQAARAQTERVVPAAFDRAVDIETGRRRFADLPPEAQTVIASLAFCCGPDLARQFPRFWRYATEQDWEAVVRTLRAFEGGASPRRQREADHLDLFLHRERIQFFPGNDWRNRAISPDPEPQPATIDALIEIVQTEFPDASIRITGRARTVREQAELMAERIRENLDEFLDTYVRRTHITQMENWYLSNPSATFEQTADQFEIIIRNALAHGAVVSRHLSDSARDISWPIGTAEELDRIESRIRELGGSVIREPRAPRGRHWHIDWGDGDVE